MTTQGLTSASLFSKLQCLYLAFAVVVRSLSKLQDDIKMRVLYTRWRFISPAESSPDFIWTGLMSELRWTFSTHA